jgi:hypothetical protein
MNRCIKSYLTNLSVLLNKGHQDCTMLRTLIENLSQIHHTDPVKILLKML